MVVYFLRHGDEVDGVRGGWSDVPLSAAGRDQIARLGNRLRQEQLPATAIHCSDLPRARETGALLAEVLDLPITYTPDWREANNGLLANLCNDEAEQRFPGLYWNTLKFREPYPGGESPYQFQQRILGSLSTLTADANSIEPGVFVVTHGGPIQIALSHIAGSQWTNRAQVFRIATASISSIEWNGAKWLITRVNDTAHLG